MSEKKQPDVRFQGFRGDWEKKEFSNTFDTFIPTNTLSRANLNYEQGAVKNIHYGDVLIKFGEITDVLKEKIPFITDADVTKYKNQFLENGDIIFADAAEDETVGKATEISGITEEKIVSGLHTISCRPIKSNSTGYWGYYLNSSAYHNQLLPLMQGIKVLSISKRSLSNTFVRYPNEEKEQNKIGELFKSLDNLIALNQSKYDKLVSMKKACLEKMFPKDGADTPKIRFAGFSGKWDNSFLCNIAKFSKGKGYSKNDLVENGVAIVLYGRLYTKYETVITEIDTFALGSINSVYSTGNEVLVPASGETPEDIARASAIEKSGVLLGGDLNIISPTKNIDSAFLALTITYGKQQKELAKLAQGKSVVHLHNSDLEQIKMLYPHIKEQAKISELFKNFDNLITLRKTELEKLKNIKKALLEKMFI